MVRWYIKLQWKHGHHNYPPVILPPPSLSPSPLFFSPRSDLKIQYFYIFVVKYHFRPVSPWGNGSYHKSSVLPFFVASMYKCNYLILPVEKKNLHFIDLSHKRWLLPSGGTTALFCHPNNCHVTISANLPLAWQLPKKKKKKTFLVTHCGVVPHLLFFPFFFFLFLTCAFRVECIGWRNKHTTQHNDG